MIINAAMARSRGTEDSTATPFLQTLAAFLGGGLTRNRPRIAAMTLAALAALMLGNAALAPVSARSLPGDGLYVHKMIQRRAKLLVSAVSPAWHDRVRAEISAETLLEVDELQTLAREVDIRLEGELRGFEDHTADGDTHQHGVLYIVKVGDDGVAETHELAWRSPPTHFDLPEGYESMADVPSGTDLSLQVRTGGDDPFALSVRTLGLDPIEPHDGTPTDIAPTPEQETPVPPEPETATPPATPTDVPSPTATVPATPTVVASPTPTASPTLPVTKTEPISRPKSSSEELRGVIWAPESLSGASSMIVRHLTSADSDEPVAGDGWTDVRVEFAAARASAEGSRAELWGKLARGRNVKLRGRFTNPERTAFTATKLLAVTDGCLSATAIGTVASFEAGSVLVLADGTRFALTGAEKIEGTPRKGDSVRIVYENCTPLPSVVERIVVESAAAVSEEFSGTVSAILGGSSFEIEDAGRGARFEVRYDPSAVAGAASVIEVGQIVRLDGILVEPNVIEATGTVVVVRAASIPTPTDVPSTATDVPPTPTDIPAPTMTPLPPTPMPAPTEILPPTEPEDPDARIGAGR